VTTTELYILCWSELSLRKQSPTSATAHYFSPDNAIWLVAQCELSGYVRLGWLLGAVDRKISHRPAHSSIEYITQWSRTSAQSILHVVTVTKKCADLIIKNWLPWQRPLSDRNKKQRPLKISVSFVSDVSLEDSGNYTCQVRGQRSVVEASVTHYIFVRGQLRRCHTECP